MHNLSDEERFALFYVSAHSGVIYDCSTRTQKLLQGHCNPITACAVSADKKWIATADAGPDSLIVVWDSHAGTPVKTFFNPAVHGIAAVDISADGAFLATLSALSSGNEEEVSSSKGTSQTLAVWEWTSADQETALFEESFPVNDPQFSVRFNPQNPQELVSNGAKNVFFWNWLPGEPGVANSGGLQCYSPRVQKSKFGSGTVGAFTASVFLPDSPSGQVATGTSDGDVMVWELPTGPDGNPVTAESHSDPESIVQAGSPERAASKLIRLGEGSLTVVTIVGKFLCLAGEDGAVRFYDMQFRLEAWFEDMEAGPVTSVSFSASAFPRSNPARLDFVVPDFVVGTRQAYVVHMEAVLFEEVEADNRRGTLLVQGMSDEVHGIAMHPYKEEIAIACYSGGLYLWDYSTKVGTSVQLLR